MITHILFESSVYLIAIWSIVEMALVTVWRALRSCRSRWAVWIGVAALPVLLVVQHWVVTERERVIDLCVEMGGKVEQCDVDGIGEHLAPEFESAGLNHTGMLAALRDRLVRYHAEEVRLVHFGTDFSDPDRPTITFDASCRVTTRDQILDRLRTRWRLTLSRVGDAWMVSRIELLPSPGSPFSNLGDLIH